MRIFHLALQLAHDLRQAARWGYHWIRLNITRKPDAKMPRGLLLRFGDRELNNARHASAIEIYTEALSREPHDLLLRQQIGVTAFLAGRYREAETWFVSLAHLRSYDAWRWSVQDQPFRILDYTWMMAIGHIASIDSYIKSVKLGWYPERTTLVAYNATNPPAGWPLFRFFARDVQVVAARGEQGLAIDEIIHGENLSKIGQHQRNLIRVALSQHFWSGPDRDARIRWYGPLNAMVEAAWKAEGRGPLYALEPEERVRFRRSMAQVYGLPEDAWFVMLHVREAGYHAWWHARHPGTRNADIHTYEKVVDFVRSRGGWVVRAGDPSMVPIRPREGVIDYALSPYRSSEIDVNLCADCTYFIGTNSGFSLVPPVFGRRCVLTNWSPIGTPNWYLDDIVIPKLIRRESNGQHLTFREMYSTFAGWSQFQRDFKPLGLVVEDNSPEDLLEAVQELHAEIFDEPSGVTEADRARLKRFNDIVEAHGGYIGSRMGYAFLRRYAHLLDD